MVVQLLNGACHFRPSEKIKLPPVCRCTRLDSLSPYCETVVRERVKSYLTNYSGLKSLICQGKSGDWTAAIRAILTLYWKPIRNTLALTGSLISLPQNVT
jgi:hypothetical protein